MLESDCCIVGSTMTVMTLDVKLEWNSISNWLDYVLMYMSAMYCVCMHTFNSAHIYMVFNSVKCVHYFCHQVDSSIITYLSHR